MQARAHGCPMLVRDTMWDATSRAWERWPPAWMGSPIGLVPRGTGFARADSGGPARPRCYQTPAIGGTNAPVLSPPYLPGPHFFLYPKDRDSTAPSAYASERGPGSPDCRGDAFLLRLAEQSRKLSPAPHSLAGCASCARSAWGPARSACCSPTTTRRWCSSPCTVRGAAGRRPVVWVFPSHRVRTPLRSLLRGRSGRWRRQGTATLPTGRGQLTCSAGHGRAGAEHQDP